MNRTDRLLAIVLELQGKRRQRAEDLAATFETSVRTIYRDMQALGQAGVPLISVPGRGYSLVEGYFLPPVSFTTDEAVMLLLGADVMSQSFDADYHEASLAAIRKIASVLSERQQADVEAVRESLRFIEAGQGEGSPEQGKLRLLRSAIVARQRVCLRYQARRPSDALSRGEPREVDPYGLVHVGGRWYLNAYCHLRHDVRNFRLERIEEVIPLERAFTRPAGVGAMTRGPARGEMVIRALVAGEMARWVRESRFFHITALEDTPDGLLVTLHAREERDVVQWLLGWGRHIRVLEPASLRRLVAEEAEALLREHVEH